MVYRYIGGGSSRSDCFIKPTQLENQSTYRQVVSTSIRRASCGDKYLPLHTLGGPISVKVDAKQEVPKVFSAEDASKMKP